MSAVMMTVSKMNSKIRASPKSMIDAEKYAESMIMEMFTKLFVMRIVARSFCGWARSFIRSWSFCLSLSARASFSFGVRENMATSLPDAKALRKRRKIRRHPTPTVSAEMGFRDISVRLEVRL